jgi:hypothetical protein
VIAGGTGEITGAKYRGKIKTRPFAKFSQQNQNISGFFFPEQGIFPRIPQATKKPSPLTGAGHAIPPIYIHVFIKPRKRTVVS